jgi:hypothetical protein
MPKAIPFIIGGLEIAGGIALEVISGGANPYGWYLISGGAGTVLGGVGSLLSQPQTGLAAASRNPSQPWNVVYGQVKIGGTIVFVNSHGDSDKYLDLVFVLAAHPCQSVDALLFDNQRVLIDPVTKCSYTPTQRTINIASIVRTQGMVTVTLSGSSGDLQSGDQVDIVNVSGTTSNDRSLNGRYYVSVTDPTHFTYLSGGLDISLGPTGQVKTLFPDYRSKVYMEALLGNQTSTFNGMLNGTPYDGDTGNLVTVSNNPWTDQHLLNGRTCVMLRLHYNDEVFSAGIPQISFRLHGKTDIYDPRNDTVVARPTVLMNGWGNNAHEGPYEMGEDQAFNWGLNDDTTYPYDFPEAAIDGNLSTVASSVHRHTHKYAGCIYSFAAVTGATYLNVMSAVPSSGAGGLRSAGIYYSLDGGTTWTKIYDQATRGLQWDNVALPGGQDTSRVQVMAFLDSHDDMMQQVFDIHLGTGPAHYNGYTENAALCIADYLSNSVYGFKAKYGTEIPSAQLISAANICDENVPLAGGGSEPRYTCNGQFQLSTRRGEILQNMLTSCGGRLTYQGGQFIIHPAAWTGSTLSIGVTPTSVVLTVWTSYSPPANANTQGIVAYSTDPNSVVPSGDVNLTTLGTSFALHTTSPAGLGSHTSLTLTGHKPWEYYVNASILYTGTTLADSATLSIYDCYMDVTNSDGSVQRYRPTIATSYPTPLYGTLTNPSDAMDADTSDAAVLHRTEFVSDLLTTGVHCPVLQLSGFALSSVSGPDMSPPGMIASGEAMAIASGPFTWKSKLAIRDLYNGVKGTYISPANGWQNSDFPAYAQDNLHGYNGPSAFEGDQNLADDGGDRRWLEIQLPFTISPAASQRLAKIELLRRRQQGSGTFAFNMSMYQTTALDVVTMTFPLLGWYSKLLEVNAHRLALNKQGELPLLGCELDFQETDPSVYEWDASEQLAPNGGGTPALPNTRTVQPPTGVTAVSGSTTTVTGADGVSRSRILVSWTPPTDGYVLNGGHMLVQYQKVSSPASTTWIGLPSVDPSVTQVYIDGVTDGQQYVVQVQAVNAAGSTSDWVPASPVTVSGTATVLPPASIGSGGASTGNVLVWNGTSWVPGPASSIELQTNSVDNPLQSKLNLKSGSNVTLTADSLGGVTIAAAAGSTTTFVRETPTGTMNGTNKTFTLSFTPITGSLNLFLNIIQIASVDYTLSGNTITFTVAPKATDLMMAQYSH